jgi:hypothetical protein
LVRKLTTNGSADLSDLLYSRSDPVKAGDRRCVQLRGHCAIQLRLDRHAGLSPRGICDRRFEHRLPSHFDAITFENMIRKCWAKVEWGHGRILVRDGANAGWIDYMLKDRQKSEFDGFPDCIIIESLQNPIADA